MMKKSVTDTVATNTVTSTHRHPRGLFKRLTAILRQPASILDANVPPDHSKSVSLEAHIEREDGEPDLLMPQIVIDRKTLTAFDNRPIDLSELERSLAGDGTFFIWVCSYGAAGCGGRMKGVRVTHSKGVVLGWSRYLFFTQQETHELQPEIFG